MPYTIEELKHKTLADLRDIAKGIEHEAVQGYTQLNKEHLLPAICKALGIEHSHHHVEAGFDKSELKMRMKMLRVELDKSLEAHDSAKRRAIRSELHALNHRIRTHIV